MEAAFAVEPCQEEVAELMVFAHHLDYVVLVIRQDLSTDISCNLGTEWMVGLRLYKHQ